MVKKGRKSKVLEEAPKECKPKSIFPEISIPVLMEKYRGVTDMLTEGFKGDTNRVTLETNWGHYMVFRTKREDREFYFIHGGCSCNFQCMTPRMQYFQTFHDAVKFIVSGSVLNTMTIEDKVCCNNKCAMKICKGVKVTA